MSGGLFYARRLLSWRSYSLTTPPSYPNLKMGVLLVCYELAWVYALVEGVGCVRYPVGGVLVGGFGGGHE